MELATVIEEFKKLSLQQMLCAPKFLEFGRKDTAYKMKKQLPRLHLKDGVSLSVQASENHYARPRADAGPYTAVEVGFVQECAPPDAWAEWRDSPEGHIWAYIPIFLVEFFLAAHGGIDHIKTFQEVTTGQRESWFSPS